MTEAGWHPDPLHRHQLRWYDGLTWTAQVSDAGHTSVDPWGTEATPAPAVPQAASPLPPPDPASVTAPPPHATGPAKTGPGKTLPVVIGIAVVALVGGAAFFLLGGGDAQDSLDTEVEGLRALLDGADPEPDSFEPLGEDCIVDPIQIVEDAGVDDLDDPVAEEAAAFPAEGFDVPFYDCYVQVGSGNVGFAIDVAELGDGSTVEDLVSVLKDLFDIVEVLDDGLHDGQLVEACRDSEVLDGDGDIVDDVFCELHWTFDGAGISIAIVSYESLGMDLGDVLDVAVPEVREALRDAAP